MKSIDISDATYAKLQALCDQEFRTMDLQLSYMLARLYPDVEAAEQEKVQLHQSADETAGSEEERAADNNAGDNEADHEGSQQASAAPANHRRKVLKPTWMERKSSHKFQMINLLFEQAKDKTSSEKNSFLGRILLASRLYPQRYPENPGSPDAIGGVLLGLYKDDQLLERKEIGRKHSYRLSDEGLYFASELRKKFGIDTPPLRNKDLQAVSQGGSEGSPGKGQGAALHQ